MDILTVDTLSPSERAIRSFEELHRLWVCVHDLRGTLVPSLSPGRSRHQNSACSAVKSAGFEQSCTQWCFDTLRRDLPFIAQGRIQLCHAGLVEWVVPRRDDQGVEWILFAGGRRAGSLPDITQARPGPAQSVVHAHELPPIDRREADLVLEAVHQLAARLAMFTRHQSPGANPAPAMTRRTKILLFLAENHSSDLHLEDLGALLHLSPNRASTAIRAACGKGFATLLREARLRTARDLLTLTDLPIVEVAIRSGFSDLSAFFRAFRQAHDASPQHWRKHRRSTTEAREDV
jgi:AraC-like DNA-binding protein